MSPHGLGLHVRGRFTKYGNSFKDRTKNVYLLNSQRSPKYGLGHVQCAPSSSVWHSPPFKHVTLAHGALLNDRFRANGNEIEGEMNEKKR